jgi:hypothetical protein
MAGLSCHISVSALHHDTALILMIVLELANRRHVHRILVANCHEIGALAKLAEIYGSAVAFSIIDHPGITGNSLPQFDFHPFAEGLQLDS